MERLPDASRVRTLHELKSLSADSMAVDLEESSTMEVDDENGRPKTRFFNPSLKKEKFLAFCSQLYTVIMYN